MNKIDKIFYLNLDRRVDRKQHFLNECVHAGIPLDKIERVPALDGLTYVLTDREKFLFENCDFKGSSHFNRIACNQMGHYNMLKKIVDNNYNYSIIFQDDVIFRDNFIQGINNLMDNYPKEADLINIGLHKYAVFDKFIPWDFNNSDDYNEIGSRKINDFVCALKNDINPCSLAYIVSNQGAKNLLEYFDKVGFRRATDWNYNDYCSDRDIFYGSISVLCTGNPKLGSDIFC